MMTFSHQTKSQYESQARPLIGLGPEQVLDLTEQALPGTLPRKDRPIVEVAANADAVGIQKAIPCAQRTWMSLH